MTELPTGTVTFLLTDVEGSTRAWEADPAAMREAMARHDDLLAKVIDAHGGARPVEQGEGDSVVAAFARASDAVAAAVEAQLTLADTGLRVRMAIHTGETEVRDGRYAGTAIIRAARLRSLAHGGQILVSQSTADLVDDDVALRGLGPHRLRDVAKPVGIFQVEHPDLRREFPPLQQSAISRHNLPTYLTTFIGRESELEELAALLGAFRLVTITGAGGCGKTRLAVEVGHNTAEQFPDGVYWVELGAVNDPPLLGGAVLTAMSLQADPRITAEAQLAVYARERTLLLVLDNCEHVLDTVSELVGTVLGGCRGVRVLATSREPLGVDGEATWRAPGLAVPVSASDDAVDHDAVKLFVERATRAQPGFTLDDENTASVVAICSRLDGIPQAIELAAARIRSLPLTRIESGLTDVLRLLSGGSRAALPRQQTLLASVEWSHDLLSPEQRVALRRLAVFLGGFSLEAATAVVAGDGLPADAVEDGVAQLVDRSLVEVTDRPGRYRLLETVRQFAVDQLRRAGEAETVRDRHLDYIRTLVTRLGPQLYGPSQVEVCTELLHDRENIRSAVQWALGRSDSGTLAETLPYLLRYWQLAGLTPEAQRWCSAALDVESAAPLDEAWMLYSAAAAAFWGSDPATFFPAVLRAIELGRRVEDPGVVARSLVLLGVVEAFVGADEAGVHLEEAVALSRRTTDPRGSYAQFQARPPLVIVESNSTDLVMPSRRLDELRLAAEQTGEPTLFSWYHFLGSMSARMRGDLGQAAAEADAALAIERRRVDTNSFTYAAFHRGLTACATGDDDIASALVDEVARALERSPSGTPLAILGHLRGVVALHRGDLDRARAELAASHSTFGSSLYRYMTAAVAQDLGRTSVALGLDEDAAALAEEMAAIAQTLGNEGFAARAGQLLGRVALSRGRLHEADAELHAALDTFHSRGYRLEVVTSLELLSAAAAARGDHHAAARHLGSVDVSRSAIGFVRAPVDQPYYDTTVEACRAALGDDAFESAYAEGKALSLDEAVAYATRARGERKRPSTGWASLTPTETDVVRLVAEGLTNPEIGERLFMARSTVKTHLKHVFEKLGVSTRTELAAEALKRRHR